MNNITILTEVGKNIGLGHYTRCSSLYQVLTKVGNHVRFVVYENDYQTDIFKGLENDSPKVYPDDVGY